MTQSQKSLPPSRGKVRMGDGAVRANSPTPDFLCAPARTGPLEGGGGKKRGWFSPYQWGVWAEIWAAAYLILRGYRFCAWRYKTPVGEIDLVMRRGKVMVFVEVKARADLDDGVAAIRPASYGRLQRAALHYMQRYRLNMDMRFDLVAVSATGRLRHLDNIQLSGP